MQEKQVGCYFGPRSRLRGSLPGGVLFRGTTLGRESVNRPHIVVSLMGHFNGGL